MDRHFVSRWIAIHRYYGRGKGTLQAWLTIFSIVSLRSNVSYLLCCRWLLGCVSLGRWLWLNTYHPSSAWRALGLSTIFLCSGLGLSWSKQHRTRIQVYSASYIQQLCAVIGYTAPHLLLIWGFWFCHPVYPTKVSGYGDFSPGFETWSLSRFVGFVIHYLLLCLESWPWHLSSFIRIYFGLPHHLVRGWAPIIWHQTFGMVWNQLRLFRFIGWSPACCLGTWACCSTYLVLSIRKRAIFCRVSACALHLFQRCWVWDLQPIFPRIRAMGSLESVFRIFSKQIIHSLRDESALLGDALSKRELVGADHPSLRVWDTYHLPFWEWD